MQDTARTPAKASPFAVVIRDRVGRVAYWSGHRTPAAAARRLASVIRQPRNFVTWGPDSDDYPTRFYVEDYRLHDSGAAFRERGLNDLRTCYGLNSPRIRRGATVLVDGSIPATVLDVTASVAPDTDSVWFDLPDGRRTHAARWRCTPV